MKPQRMTDEDLAIFNRLGWDLFDQVHKSPKRQSQITDYARMMTFSRIKGMIKPADKIDAIL